MHVHHVASRGVLALAHKVVPDAEGEAARDWPRESVETGLSFCGFIAFACKTRADSGTVVAALLESAHSVVMLTGDAPLTALHVAREVAICERGRPELLLTTDGCTDGQPIRWVRATGGSEETVATFDASKVRT